jgi:hypothetical protein
VKILIRATNWVGDAIMAIPALRAVRAKFPDAHMAILARPYVADIYHDQEIADELIAYDWKGIHAGFGGRERLVMSRYCCKMRSMPPGWRGAQKFRVASVMPATVAASC